MIIMKPISRYLIFSSKMKFQRQIVGFLTWYGLYRTFNSVGTYRSFFFYKLHNFLISYGLYGSYSWGENTEARRHLISIICLYQSNLLPYLFFSKELSRLWCYLEGTNCLIYLSGDSLICENQDFKYDIQNSVHEARAQVSIWFDKMFVWKEKYIYIEFGWLISECIRSQLAEVSNIPNAKCFWRIHAFHS